MIQQISHLNLEQEIGLKQMMMMIVIIIIIIIIIIITAIIVIIITLNLKRQWEGQVYVIIVTHTC